MEKKQNKNLELQAIFKEESIPLLEVDTEFGLISTIGCLGHLRLHDTFSFVDCLLKMRECVAIQDLLFRKSTNMQENISNLQRAESLILQNPIKSNKLPQNFLNEIFSTLYKENYIEHMDIKRKSHRYTVTKKKDHNNIEKYVNRLSSNLFPVCNLSYDFISNDNPLDEPQLDVINKIKYSIELLEQMNTSECRDAFSSTSTFPHKYQNLLNFPLVSASRETNAITIYILSCFRCPEIELARSHIQVDHLFLKMLQNSQNIKILIKNISKQFNLHSNLCYGNKLLIRKPHTDHLYVITHLVFSKEALRASRSSSHRLKRIYTAIDQKLKNEVYFKPNDYFTFALGEADANQ